MIPIPGANAALSALVASGLPADEFHFIGFLPEKAGARRTRLESLAAEVQRNEASSTLVFYEAPHRILDTLADLEFVWGPQLQVVVARELTLLPRHWEWLSGQSGGASVALRKLVEQARKTNEGRDRQRRAQEAAYRFMSAVAGNLAGFEEAIRALFGADRARFDELVAPWPPDVSEYAKKLAVGAFAQTNE